MVKKKGSRHISKGWIVLIVLMVFAAGLTAWILYDNTRVVTTTISVPSDKVTEELIIAQVSDFHNSQRLAEKMVSAVAQVKPQLIAITGDFIDENHTDIDLAVSTAQKLAEIAPCYFVTGNHEALSREFDTLIQKLEEMGIRILDGKSEEWNDQVVIYGVQDPAFDWGYNTGSVDMINKKLDQFKPKDDKFNLLLSHRPEAMQAYVDHAFDLVLTGHAHGGQVRIPFVGGLVAPDQGFLPEYDSGLYQENHTSMIVSRGIGNSILPIRVNDPGEIVVIKIGEAGK